MNLKELWEMEWIVQVRTFGTRCGHMCKPNIYKMFFTCWILFWNEFIGLVKVENGWNRLETNYNLDIS